ncbi:hypothetical protein BDU57DRAFT_534506 [Ampelomyces quisqualis]|uniref:C3H1-type domain-containing protein n=1 Tax=Ampelomyces quisqualis TaxID=50730 RepID=A0A6A5QZU3_AMPQU|nr:hypothetical protein BDU57DRAFT_534506 [Ampelomyces quisqualis]
MGHAERSSESYFADITPFQTPFGASTSEAQLELDSAQAGKKRKVEGGSDLMSKDIERSTAEIKEWRAAFYKAKAAYRKEQEAKLSMQSDLDDKINAVHRMKVKQAKRDDEHARIVSRMEADSRQLHQAGLVQEGKKLVLKSRVTQYEKTVNQLEMEKDELKAKNIELLATIQKLQLKIKHGRHPASRQPTLVPDPNPDIRNHDEYEHPEAPHMKRTYRYFVASLPYTTGTGKVWPSRYGSNGHWDLGLCQVHFNTEGDCKFGDQCEYRHDPLTQNERVYITMLKPLGTKFLASSDKCLFFKSPQSKH